MITVLLRKLFASSFLFLVGFLPLLQATHIIGGEMNYACLGDHQYEISLTIYRDCYLGEALMDDTAYVAVYDHEGLLLQTVPILLGAVDTVEQAEDCYLSPSTICVETTAYKDTVTLLPRAGGYHISYQRCCRNATILNIIDPLNTGATFEIQVSEAALQACNTSPKIKSWPPTFVCVNQPLVFDHAAKDKDGDSLVYSLCTPFEGGISLINPRPRPSFPPPYKNIRWNEPTYNLENVLGGIPLSIDATTGLLEGTPNTVGQFVVGICVEEYRNGVVISTTKRDFQYNIIPCQEATASFSLPETQCKDTAIRPLYRGVGMTHFNWNVFNDQILVASSKENQPVFDSLVAGIYEVQLIVTANGTCVDSITQSITLVENDITVDFDYQLSGCQDDMVLTLTNTSSSDIFTQWTIQGDSNQYTSLANNLEITPIYESTLSVQLEVINEVGCKNTLQKTLTIPIQDIVLQADFNWTVDNCQPNSYDLKVWDTSSFPTNTTWQWSLSNGMTSDEQQPSFSITTYEELEINLTLTNSDSPSCQSTFTAKVPAHLSASQITTSETIHTCEANTTSELHAYGDNIARQWWIASNGDTLSYEEQVNITAEESTTITVELEDSLGCVHQRSIAIDYHPLEVSYEPLYEICKESIDTLVVSTTSSLPLVYSWSVEEQPIGENSNELIIQPTESTYYQFEVQNELGCTHFGAIEVAVGEQFPNVAITTEQTSVVAGNTIVLNATYDPNYTYQWSPSELLDDPTTASVIATPLENTFFQVAITDQFGCKAEAIQEVLVVSGNCIRPFIFIPNAFTPNGDGENDMLFVRGSIIQEMQLIIYDRWGDNIFETSDLATGWDRTKNGTQQHSGVFGYYSYVKCLDSNDFFEKGNITLIR